ncbi:MAG: hypothetical protein GY915_03945 [bacterium]|nr:hypothetical protein [bacterium]
MYATDIQNDSADQFNSARLDKPCGASYIPQNAKCKKGAGKKAAPAKGKPGRNSPENNGGERVNPSPGYAKFLKKKGVNPSKLGGNSSKAQKLAEAYSKTKTGKAAFKKGAAEYERGQKEKRQKGRRNLRNALLAGAGLGLAGALLKRK